MASTTRPVTVLEETQRDNGATAAVLAIDTANPANCLRQDEYADWFFRITKSDHLDKLKDKMKRICEKSGIEKRCFHHTEEMINAHPEIVDRAGPSLRARLGITAEALPELAAAAAGRAIAEWGRPATDITHLVVNTNSFAGSPGADLRLAAALGLRPTVQRTQLCLHGCSGGSVALRLAKDLAESNRNLGARVLVVCVEVTALAFQAPDATNLHALFAMTLFADGAGAAVVGAGPKRRVERPVFHMVRAAQVTVPGTERAVGLRVSERGLDFEMSVELPRLVAENVPRCLADALAPVGLGGSWNDLFWAVHPGGRAVLDSYQAALGLEPGKLAASQQVLGEYGNMLGATIFLCST